MMSREDIRMITIIKSETYHCNICDEPLRLIKTAVEGYFCLNNMCVRYSLFQVPKELLNDMTPFNEYVETNQKTELGE